MSTILWKGCPEYERLRRIIDSTRTYFTEMNHPNHYRRHCMIKFQHELSTEMDTHFLMCIFCQRHLGGRTERAKM